MMMICDDDDNNFKNIRQAHTWDHITDSVGWVDKQLSGV
jgi:hypothetical protein